MTTSLLIVGAIAVFLAVFAIAYSVQSIVAERRQAYRTIQAIRAVELRPADLRNRELARPARERLIKPFYNAALGLTRRFTPAGARDAIRRKLIQAGSPFGWDGDRVLVAKVAGLVGGAVFGLLFLAVFSFAWPLRVLGFVLISLLGYWLPNIVLTNAVQRRQTEIRTALPDSIDLLTICVEAGLGYDAAMAHVSKNTTGPLADDWMDHAQCFAGLPTEGRPPRAADPAGRGARRARPCRARPARGGRVRGRPLAHRRRRHRAHRRVPVGGARRGAAGAHTAARRAPRPTRRDHRARTRARALRRRRP